MTMHSEGPAYVDGAEAGNASFNSADRQAVVNLISSYGPLYDSANLTEWRGLFSEEPVMEFWKGGTKLIEGIDAVLTMIKGRQGEFKKNRIQRRHYLIPRVTRQDPGSASGDAYLLLMSNDGTNPSLVTTGYYEFTSVKEGGAWKIRQWIAHLDNSLD